MARPKTLCLIGAALLVVSAATSVHADDVQVRDSAASPGFFVTGTHADTLRATTDGSSYHRFHTGTFEFEADYGNGWEPLETYCLEPSQYIKFGTQPGDTVGRTYTYTAIENYAPLTTDEGDFLGLLWANAFDDAMAGTKTAAAFQAIVWETAIDDNFNLTGGDFRLSQSSTFTSDVLAIAAGWVSKIADQSWTDGVSLAVLEHPCSQDFLTPYVPTTPTPVPTPSAWALGAIGLVLVGLRKRAKGRAAV